MTNVKHIHQILVYADSLSWGIIPNTRERFRFDQRWPGVMEIELTRMGQSVRVIEDCLNGRRTVWDDPFKPGRNGIVGIEQRIEVNSPLSMVILLLGTNDFQSMHQLNAWHSAQGVGAIISAIRRAPIEPGMSIPEILAVAPPTVQTAKGAIAPKFEEADQRAAGLAEAIEQIAEEYNCPFFDAGSVTSTSKVDGVHLDAEQHKILGNALAEKVNEIIND
ncbi:Arylesterase [Olavius algarvensis associated proteobacterium Delta 3]|nr:Arylesterase [Olavius algarvensis associated proteobacterium Delta 3]CAB5117451.1 Arylesterase [Olavius algarvensis associated proteobacterium Delta 3]